MIIRSQDRSSFMAVNKESCPPFTIQETTGLSEEGSLQVDYRLTVIVCGGDVNVKGLVFGIYSTMDRALAVVDELESCLDCEDTSVYYVPKDNDPYIVGYGKNHYPEKEN